ncbi:MAG: hypothetical protein QXZ44_00625 [Ferroplasma sp.]
MARIAIVIGTCSGMTDKQIGFLSSQGITDKFDSDDNPDICLFVLAGKKWANTGNMNFITRLTFYDNLILSGGETAYAILSHGKFKYLISSGEYLPLISSGTVIGGIFDGKKYILKGGSLGDIDIYMKLIEYATINKI